MPVQPLGAAVMARRHTVRLSAAQRQRCEALLADPGTAARVRRRARVLLLAAERAVVDAPTDARVAAAAGVSPRTVERVRAGFVRGGLERALALRPPSINHPACKLSPDQQELLFTLVASMPPPPGYPRWTTRTLAAHLNGLDGMPPVSRELVRRLLKQGELTRPEET
jgi:hypothetical protein